MKALEDLIYSISPAEEYNKILKKVRELIREPHVNESILCLKNKISDSNSIELNQLFIKLIVDISFNHPNQKIAALINLNPSFFKGIEEYVMHQISLISIEDYSLYKDFLIRVTPESFHSVHIHLSNIIKNDFYFGIKYIHHYLNIYKEGYKEANKYFDCLFTQVDYLTIESNFISLFTSKSEINREILYSIISSRNISYIKIKQGEYLSLTNKQKKFLLYKIIGYFYMKPKFITSFIIEVSPLEGDESLLLSFYKDFIELVGFSYSSTISDLIKTSALDFKYKSSLVEILSVYLENLNEAKNIKEFQFSPIKRQQYNYLHSMKIQRQFKKESNKGFLYNLLVDKEVHVKSNTTFSQNMNYQEMKMQSIHSTLELPFQLSRGDKQLIEISLYNFKNMRIGDIDEIIN